MQWMILEVDHITVVIVMVIMIIKKLKLGRRTSQPSLSSDSEIKTDR